jgi:predicted DNA-binding transcriptional regulator AlpA
MAELQKKYITSSQLCERFCKSTRTLLRWQNQFNFPKPDISYQGGSNLWDLAEVEKWEQEQQSNTKCTAQ